MDYLRKKELGNRARLMRNNMTIPERILWTRIQSRQLEGYKFRRQQRIFEYIVDFYCHELKLIIEVDGEIHYLEENKEYDKRRDKILMLNGYHIIHLSNLEVETEIDLVVTKLKSYITTNLSPTTVTKSN